MPYSEGILRVLRLIADQTLSMEADWLSFGAWRKGVDVFDDSSYVEQDWQWGRPVRGRWRARDGGVGCPELRRCAVLSCQG